MISWNDTRSCSEWREPDEHLPHAVIHTCGWITLDTPKYVTIVASIDDDGEFVGDVLTIPRGCIKTIKRLGV